MMHERRRSWVGGLILILLGVVFLADQFFPGILGGWLFLAGLGLIFLVAYVFTQQYGFLIPGCILGSLGFAVAVVETNTLTNASEGGVIVLSLGLGFVAIWLIDLLVTRGRRRRLWPLIPGAILGLVGVFVLFEKEEWLVNIGQWWPVILIVIGVWILLDRVIRRPS